MDLNQSDLYETQSDSENQIEEEDEPPIDFKSSAQIRFESLLLKRFANACLLLSIVLFIGHIISASTTCCRPLDHQISSILSGFVFSFLLFFTWLCIASMFKDSLPETLKNYLITNITNSSFCGMVINIKQVDSSNLIEEEGEQSENEQVQVITTSQIKLESLLHRIGNCCLTLSAILFLGQIINASLNWDLDVGSVITGFGFSIFLFMSWACIDSVYGKGASEGRMEWCRQQTSFRFRIQSIEEMKQNMPRGWLTSFSTVYFLVGISIAICEAIIMYSDNQSSKWYSGSVIAARFAYSAILILTGLLCIILTLSPQKRTSNFFCFLFAVTSLVLASYGSSGDMGYYNTGDFEPRNPKEFLAHKSRLDLNSDGEIFFLGWWTLITMMFQSFQLLIIAISTVLISICFNLWFHIALIPKSNDSDEKQQTSKLIFSIIGVILVISGFVINVGTILLTKILTPPTFSNWRDWDEDYRQYFILPFSCISLYIGGLLCLSIASSRKVTRGLILFMFSFVIMGSSILCLYNSVILYDQSQPVEIYGQINASYTKTINIDWNCKHRNYYDYKEKCPGTISQNSTDFCLNWRSDAWTDESSNSTITTCIPIEKKCDGILNFFNRTGDKFNTEDYYLRNGVVMMLGDELFCPERYISVYISIFGAAGISIILTVAIWVLTFNTIGFFGKLIAATIKKRFYSSHVPLN